MKGGSKFAENLLMEEIFTEAEKRIDNNGHACKTDGVRIFPCAVLPHPVTTAFLSTKFSWKSGRHTGMMCSLYTTSFFSLKHKVKMRGYSFFVYFSLLGTKACLAPAPDQKCTYRGHTLSMTAIFLPFLTPSPPLTAK